MFPPNGSSRPACASLPRACSGSIPLARRYYRKLRLPATPAHASLRLGYAYHLAPACSLPTATRRRHCGTRNVGSGVPDRCSEFQWRRQGLPGSWGAPARTCPALRPRRDLGAWPVRRPGVAFRRLDNVGPRDAVISGLNHTACTLAVYASQRRLPDATQDSLPVGGQPFPGGILTRRAPYAISRQAPLDDSKRPGFPGAPRPDPNAP